jgi:hypothetical protein
MIRGCKDIDILSYVTIMITLIHLRVNFHVQIFVVVT